MTKSGHILKVLGGNIRKRRIEKEWTQKDLGFAIDREPAYISKIELGRTNPTALLIEAIAIALECHPGELFEGY